MKNNKAFTLIEIMVAIGIVAILASVVLVSMKSFAAKGRSAKALAQLSSAIPSMVSCWINSGSSDYVKGPSSGGDICSINSSYGKWLNVGSGTDLSTYSYSSSASSGELSKSSWYVALTSGSLDDNKRICCNSTMNSCKSLDTAATACDASNPSY